MTKQIIYILLFLSLEGFAQQDSIQIKGQNVLIEDSIPSYKGETRQYPRSIPHLLPSKGFYRVKREEDMNRISPQRIGGGGYKSTHLFQISTQLSLAEHLLQIAQDTVMKYYYHYFKTQKFEANFKDTVFVSRNDLIHVQESVRGKYRAYVYHSPVGFYDICILNKLNGDTLNGLCKIQASPANQQKYDYYIGYFHHGSPYLENYHNIFEYYKGNTLVKRRFIKRRYAYTTILAEDYIPLGQNHWQREIRAWQEKHLTLKDTIVYRGKVQLNKKFPFITHEKYKRYHAPRSYSYYNKSDSSQTTEIVEELAMGTLFEKNKYTTKTELYLYKREDAHFFKGAKMSKWKKSYVDNRDTKYFFYSELSKDYQSLYEDFSQPIAEKNKEKERQYEYREFFADTLTYQVQQAYIEGKQMLYSLDQKRDSSYVHYIYTYKRGKMQKKYIELIVCNAEWNDVSCTDCNLIFPFDMEKYSMPSIVNWYGFIIRTDNKKGEVKKEELRYYDRQSHELKCYTKHKLIRNPRKVKRLKSHSCWLSFYDCDYSDNTCFIPKLFYRHFYNQEYIRTYKPRMGKLEVHDHLSYEGESDSMALTYLEKLKFKDAKDLYDFSSRGGFSCLRHGAYILKINKVIRYSLHIEASSYNREEHSEVRTYIVKFFDKKGKLTSEKKYVSDKLYYGH